MSVLHRGFGKWVYMRVEVLFVVSPGVADLTTLELAADTRVSQAIERSGICQRHPEITFPPFGIGIWGKVVSMDRPLKENDRLEIYLPLKLDPMEARRRRAARQPAAANSVATPPRRLRPER